MMNEKEKRELKAMFIRAHNVLTYTKSECDYIQKMIKELENKYKLNNQNKS